MDNGKYEKAKKRVKEIKGFYVSLFIYVVVNVFLLLINLITSPGSLWFYWPAIFWGFGIILQALRVFLFKDTFFGKEWEEAKIKELMDREESIK